VLDSTVLSALQKDDTVDITTIGRLSGNLSTIEIWYHRALDRYFLSGQPGPKSWVANLRANPRFTFSLKQSAQVDLAATARVITEQGERHTIFNEIYRTSVLWTPEEPAEMETRYKSAPLIEIIFDGSEE